jgi:glycosyltransferase involved in cell wall biosynthesis
MPRPDYLDLVNRSAVVVCLPNPLEGVHLPPLEAMALQSLVVCADGRGTRHHCRHRVNCLKPARDPDALHAAVVEAMSLPPAARTRMLDEGAATAAEHSLQRERIAFQEVLSSLATVREEVDPRARPC